MADVTKELEVKITSDTSGAQDGLDSFGSSLSSVGNIVTGIIVSDILVNLYDQIVDLGQAAIQSSASLQNIGVAADYAFGSNSSATKMLDTLNDISSSTPFTNEQLDTLAIRLQNMSVPTQQITGDLKDLSNIASATGTSVEGMSSVLTTAGDALATAYERGSINSLQLRSIANQGIPIYDALVKVINDEGAASVQSASSIAANTKAVAAATAEHAKLIIEIQNDQQALAIMEQKATSSGDAVAVYAQKIQNAQESLQLLENKHVYGVTAIAQWQLSIEKAKEGIAALQTQMANAADTSSQDLAIQKAKDNLVQLNEQLAKSADAMTQTGAKTEVTKADLVSTTKSITISAQQLQEAFQAIGQGKDLGAAQSQANTYNGVLKNLQQQVSETADAILGVSQSGNVTKGGLFDQLQVAATNLLNFLSANKPAIVAFGQTVIQTFENQIAPAVQAGFQWIVANKDEIIAFAKNLGTAFVNFGAWLANTGIPLIIALGNDLLKLEPIINAVANFFAAMAANAKYANTAVYGVGGNLPAGGLVGQAIASLPHFAEGITDFAGGLAVVGEHGSEVVNLPKGSSVTPNGGGGGVVNIYNPQVRSDADISAIVTQVKYAMGRQQTLARLGAI